MMFKRETTAFLCMLIEILNSVLQSTCLHCNDRSAADEELVLHDTTRFEFARHESEITSNINERSIYKKKNQFQDN